VDQLRPVLLSAVQDTLQQQQQQQGCVPPCTWLQAAVFEGCVQLLASVYQSRQVAQPPLGAATAQQLLRQVLGRLPPTAAAAPGACVQDGTAAPPYAVVVGTGTAIAAAGPHADGSRPSSSSSSSSGVPLLWMDPPALVASTDHPQQLCLRLGVPGPASPAASSGKAGALAGQLGTSSSGTSMAAERQQQLGQQPGMQRVRLLVFDQQQVVLDEEVTLAPIIRWAIGVVGSGGG
jgi:hypothetical protein